MDNTVTSPRTWKNKGKEANVYLTYLIEHYDRLPSIIAFIHSHQFAWHTDASGYDNARSLRSLRPDFVRESGYVNLRCQHSPGCPQEVQPFRKNKDKATEVVFADAWQSIFNVTDIPRIVAAPCCAQFAVSREQVLKRTRDEYIWYHHWLMNTTLEDDVSGRIFEYLWYVSSMSSPIDEPWRSMS